jgi:ATP-dependent DNA helicase 2 subunit 2
MPDEDGEFIEPFKSRHTFNPLYHRMYQCIEHRALFPELALPPPTANILKQTADVPGLIDPSKKQLVKFKAEFPLDVGKSLTPLQRAIVLIVPPKPTKKKRMEVAAVQYDTVGDLLAKEDMLKRKAERAKIVANIKATSRDPLEAFESMISHQDEDLTVEAMTHLSDAVMRTLNNGASGNGAALSYLRALRTACVDENEFARFNDLLKAVNQTHPTTFMPLLKSQGLTLISKMDADQCETTVEEARAFLEAIVGADVDEAETDEEDDD